MIGTKIRGIHHLARMVNALQEVTFFFKHDGLAVGNGVALYMNGEKYKNPFMSIDGDYLILFNDCYDNCKHDMLHRLEKTDIYDKLNSLFNKYYHIWVVPINKRNFRDESSYFNGIVVMPSDFDKMYDDFCNSNKKQIPSITKYANVDCALFRYVFAISSGSKNFFFWAINAFFKNRITIYQIESILRWSDKYKQLQSKLKKGTITAYTSSLDFFNITREITLLRRDKRANDVINMFNTAQKKILKSIKLSDRDYDTLSKFGKLSSKKKNNFIRKMSTVEDASEILRQMSFLADIHFEWNKKSFMDYYNNLENFNCEVVMEKGDIVLLKVKDYEAVKRLAKSTNWCISKDRKYWFQYVEANPNATQYVLLDFSKKEDDNLSIVGFTSVHDRGITHAHDFQNRNIMGGKGQKIVSELKSFVSKFSDCGNIYGVLDKYGISLSDVVSYEPSHYEWNRESMFECLGKCISDDDYYIIYDDGNKVVFIAEDDNIKYFLGDTYIDNYYGGHMDGTQYIIFADFTKKANDPDRLIYGIITYNFSAHESSCSCLYNGRFEKVSQSFNSKIEEYGLPYDIICRTDNVIERFYSAFYNFEVSTVKELINNKAVRDDLKKFSKVSLLRDALINATINSMSADYINLIYNNNLTLVDLLGDGYASDFVRRLINTMCDYRHIPEVPSQKDIEDFFNEAIDNYGYAVYIGFFLILMKIIDNEKEDSVLSGVIPAIVERRMKCDLFDLVMSRICEKIDANRHASAFRLIINYAFSNNSKSVINAILNKNVKGKIGAYLSSFIEKNGGYKSTEVWVKQGENAYALQGINEEAIAHAPRRR